MAYSEYKDLTPTDNIENGDEYFEALKWAFNNKKVKNIALAGSYGSGKSSIIETFLRKDEEDKSALKGFKQSSIRKSALKISMSTFLKGNCVNNDPTNEKIKVDADDVEKGILKQIFYKVKPNKIPQSRYRKLHPINMPVTIVKIFFALLFVVVLTRIFTPDKYKNFVGAIEEFISPISSAPIFTWIATTLFLAFCSVIIAYLYKTVISKFRIKEIRLPSQTTVHNGIEADSVFNKNLDEIIYFFEVTGYKTVFFEDLDRFNDPRIFIHLRELNNLLNNDDAIKKKPIVFVYAVRDDIFSKEDRTKFFDFIIPVIPVINSTNSDEILLQRLQEAQKSKIEHNISQGFIFDIAPFISDMRILQNIYNEFVIYKKTLLTSQGLSLSDEQMLAVIVFKNLYPGDFADSQGEKGILKKAFVDKNKFIIDRKQAIQEEIDNYSSLITDSQNDTLKSVKELKYAMIVTLMEDFNHFNSFSSDGNSDFPSISSSDIMRDDYDMTQLTLNYKYIYYFDRGSNYLNRKDIDSNVLNSFIDRWKVIKEVGEKGLKNLQYDLEKLREKQYKLSGMSVAELLKEYSANEIFSEEIQTNELLVFLLRQSYINETYVNYINYFKGTSITKGDMNFILSIKNRSPLEFDYGLTNASMVIARLQDYEFDQKAIYNLEIMEHLLEKEPSEKLAIFIKQLADGNEISWQFINEFMDYSYNRGVFIRLLAKEWSGMWERISEDNTLTYERQLLYLKFILSESELPTIKNQNIDGCINNYFEEHDDILQKLTDCSADKIISVIDSLNIKFKVLEIDGVSDEILDSIFNKCCYVLNEEMLKAVVFYKNNSLIDDWEEQPYSTLVALNYNPLLQYVHNSIVIFIEGIVLEHSNLSDKSDDIVNLLIRLEGEQDIQIRLIQQENFHLESIDECAVEYVKADKGAWIAVWNALLEKNVVNVNWENVFTYWKVYKFNNELKSYIINHVDELVEMDTVIIDDEFIKEFIQSEFEYEIEKKLLPVLKLEKFDLDITSISEPTLQIMVDCNYFKFTAKRYDDICSLSQDIGMDFILKNQDEYMKLRDSIPMSDDLFESLILSYAFNKENKNNIFSDYAEEYITENVALKMKPLNLSVTKDIFKAAWNCTDKEKRTELLLDHCTLLDADELEQHFEELGEPYAELADRSRRHEVGLHLTEKNKALAEHLQNICYITSCEEKDEKEADIASDQQKTRKILKLRVKQVR